MTSVLVMGLGGVGSWTLEILARSDGIDRLVTSQRNREVGELRTQIAAVGAAFQGHSKRFEFRRNDVVDVDATARLLSDVRPDVIVSSVTLQSPRVLMAAEVAPETRARLREATFSIWLPWHVLPVARLMEAVLKAGIRTHVVNVAFPDVVNPMIWRHLGLGPTAGAGNVEMIAASLQRHVANELSLRLDDVEVTIVASHAFLAPQARPVLPSFVRIRARGEDVTRRWNITEVLDGPGMVAWARTSVFSAFAASAAKNVLALVSAAPIRTTVTAPNGLPGGYPARVSYRGITLDLPDGMALDDAIRINEAGNRFDGIERIEPDGTILYTDSTREIMKEFGYDCPAVSFDQLEARSAELRGLFARVTGSAPTAATAT